MLKLRITALLLLLGVSTPSFAVCELFDFQTIMLKDSEFNLCSEVVEGLEVVKESIVTIGGLIEEEPSADVYWSEWVLNNENAPLLSQEVDDSHFGLGVWIPQELDEESELSTSEWLMSHGLQLSIGIGDKSDGKARLRFDYRWHENFEKDVMVQIEVPF